MSTLLKILFLACVGFSSGVCAFRYPYNFSEGVTFVVTILSFINGFLLSLTAMVLSIKLNFVTIVDKEQQDSIESVVKNKEENFILSIKSTLFFYLVSLVLTVAVHIVFAGVISNDRVSDAARVLIAGCSFFTAITLVGSLSLPFLLIQIYELVRVCSKDL